MWEDPIVEETRRIRREIEAECGDDFEEITAKAVEVQKRYRDKLVSRSSGLKEEEAPVSVNRV